MSRSLSWSEHLGALLNATDGNVAKINRLYPLGVSTAVWCPSSTTLGSRDSLVPERLSWAETQRAASLWDEVTILRSQLQSQAQVTEALRPYRGCWKSESSRNTRSVPWKGGPEQRALLLEQRLEGLRRELQGLQSQVQEQAQAQIQTGPRKCSASSGLHQELQNEYMLEQLQSGRRARITPWRLPGQRHRMPGINTTSIALKSVFWTISRGAHFLNWSPAAYSSRPRALSRRTSSLRASQRSPYLAIPFTNRKAASVESIFCWFY
ncbi:hypothetical protein GH733_015403 [Mirounga leonina]|nr:hypothetical protein GH733_015403 [Mirounga leonina]